MGRDVNGAAQLLREPVRAALRRRDRDQRDRAGRQGLRVLGLRELPRGPWLVRFEWHPLQPRIGKTRLRVPHSEGQPRSGKNSSRTREDDYPRKPGRETGLGVCAGVRRPDGADSPAQGTGRFRGRDGRSPLRPRVRRGSVPRRGHHRLGEARDDRPEELPALRGLQPSRQHDQGAAHPRMEGEDQIQGPGTNHGRGRHQGPRGNPRIEVTRYGLGGTGKQAVQWGSMSPRRLWYSQNRAVSIRPEQNSFTLAICSESVIPWAIAVASSCTNGLISGNRRSIAWSTPRLCVL